MLQDTADSARCGTNLLEKIVKFSIFSNCLIMSYCVYYCIRKCFGRSKDAIHASERKNRPQEKNLRFIVFLTLVMKNTKKIDFFDFS